MSQPALDLEYVDDTFTVSEIHDAVNRAIRRALGDEGVYVRGEIEGLSEGRGGHVYFQLVERTDRGRVALDVAFFASQRRRLEPYLRRHGIRLQNGLAVRIGAVVELYNGRLNAKLGTIDAAYTLGTLAMDRDALLRRLAEQGLTGRNGGLTFPVAPRRIGVVCSVGSAGHADFLHELETSGLPWELVVCDAQVQGDGAPVAIAAGIRTLGSGAHGVEVLCVVRGGGARTDLAAFDHEAVALAIARARVPVLTGIGHEIDRSVADEVAHTALKTPTACASHLVARVRRCTDGAEQTWARIAAAADRRLVRADAAVVERAHRAGRAAGTALERAGQRVERAATVLGRDAAAALRLQEQRLATAADRLARSGPQRLADAERLLDVHAARVAALDPALALARGWSITRRTDGTLVRSPDDVQPGDELRTLVAGGEITSTATAGDR